MKRSIAAISFLFVIFVVSASGQSETKNTSAAKIPNAFTPLKPKCARPTVWESFRDTRITPPVEITAITERGEVFYLFKGAKEIVLGSFLITSNSQLPKIFVGTPPGKFWIFYAMCPDMEGDGEILKVARFEPDK